jgi:hypothetical protein
VADAIASCLTVHRRLAITQPIPVPLIGWDVALLEDGAAMLEGNPLSGISRPQKLAGAGAWRLAAFRESMLSYLAPLEGQRIALDPRRHRAPRVTVSDVAAGVPTLFLALITHYGVP